VKAEDEGLGRRFKGETTVLIYKIEVKQSADAGQTMGGKGRKGFNETKRPWFVGAPSRGHGGNGLNLTGSTQMYYSEAERAKVGHHFDQ